MVLFELAGIAFAYPERPPLFRDLDFSLNAGERLGIVGANGAGKSTLLLLLVGLLKPQAGRVIAFGRVRQRETDFIEVRQRAGLVFQDPDDQLFCPTVLEDVAFGPLNLGLSKRQALQRVEQTLGQLELDHLRDRLTHGLSGGEKRLISLAAVLAMAPDVLLLDEPSNGLDAAMRNRLLTVLSQLPQALVLVSHDHDLMGRLTDRQWSLPPPATRQC